MCETCTDRMTVALDRATIADELAFARWPEWQQKVARAAVAAELREETLEEGRQDGERSADGMWHDELRPQVEAMNEQLDELAKEVKNVDDGPTRERIIEIGQELRSIAKFIGDL